MTEAIPQETTKAIISQITYEDSNPIYQKIRKEFTKKLQDKYDCQNYEAIVDYVFDFVFKQKLDKSVCIEKLDPYFNNKSTDILNYLWQITKEAEDEHKAEAIHINYNNKKGGKNRVDKYKNNKQKFHREKRERERSRSYSREKDDNMYENYQMQPKGFYPPKRFPAPPMRVIGGYPQYFQSPQMMPNYMR